MCCLCVVLARATEMSSDFFDRSTFCWFSVMHGNYFDHLLDWEREIEAHPNLPVFVSSYEEMKRVSDRLSECLFRTVIAISSQTKGLAFSVLRNS